MKRRSFVKTLAIAASVAAVFSSSAFAQQKTVKVGILHSLSGTMAISETGAVQAEKLAIEQINAGGVSCLWARMPGTPAERTILYLHGGAFLAGSSRTHRHLGAALHLLAENGILAGHRTRRGDHHFGPGAAAAKQGERRGVE